MTEGGWCCDASYLSQCEDSVLAGGRREPPVSARPPVPLGAADCSDPSWLSTRPALGQPWDSRQDLLQASLVAAVDSVWTDGLYSAVQSALSSYHMIIHWTT